jgi:hypothetical protein
MILPKLLPLARNAVSSYGRQGFVPTVSCDQDKKDGKEGKEKKHGKEGKEKKHGKEGKEKRDKHSKDPSADAHGQLRSAVRTSHVLLHAAANVEGPLQRLCVYASMAATFTRI